MERAPRLSEKARYKNVTMPTPRKKRKHGEYVGIVAFCMERYSENKYQKLPPARYRADEDRHGRETCH